MKPPQKQIQLKTQLENLLTNVQGVPGNDPRPSLRGLFFKRVGRKLNMIKRSSLILTSSGSVYIMTTLRAQPPGTL